LDEYLNLAILWPRRFSAFSDNNLSTVLKLTYGNSSVLLTGDIHEEAELEIGRLPVSLDSDILKVPHHGSRTSSSLPFLAAVSPDWAVISCDSSVYGLPNEETIADLLQVGLIPKNILRTDRMGTIRFNLFPDRVELMPASF
jgi:competence protein ComEC